MKTIFTVFAVLFLLSALAEAQTFTDIGASLTPAWNCSVAWGDYDNDGDLDVVIAGYIDGSGTTATKLYRNDNGSFVNSGMVFSGAGASALAWGDYDNDGDLDIIISGKVSGSNDSTLLYRNDQTVFTKINSSFFKVLSGTLAWGDYDNDGDLDLLIGGSDQSNLYRNDGGDVFTATNAITETLSNGTFIWGDYDKDGWLDFAMIGRISSNNYVARIYHNNHNGTFTDINAGLWGSRYSSADWGDYDNDGDLDLIYCGNYNSLKDTTILYRNDNGIFAHTLIPFTGLRNGSLNWGDYDNDGDLDLLAAGDTSATSALGAKITCIYKNNGSDQFQRVDYGFVQLRNCSAKWGDYNNDGDLDILIAGYDSTYRYVSKIYRNTAVTHNTSPANPSLYPATVNGDTIIFRWFSGSDNQTPSKSLTYNLRVGTTPGGSDIVSGMANSSTGFRRIPAMGNTNLDTTWMIHALNSGTYYWSVQTIDQAYAGSAFSADSSFSFTNYKPNVIRPFTDTLVLEDFGKIFIDVLTNVFFDSNMTKLAFIATSLDGGLTTLISHDSLYVISKLNVFGLNRVKVTAGDGLASVNDTFIVSINNINDAPTTFSLLLPVSGDTLHTIPDSILFKWCQSKDADLDPLAYTLHIFNTNYDTVIIDIQDTFLLFTNTDWFAENSVYDWTMSVSDGFEVIQSIDTFIIYTGSLIGFESGYSLIPEYFNLHHNFPNPFNPSTTIKYELPQSGKVTLKIYNLLGQEVRTLVNGHESAGFKSVIWDGRNNNGKAVSSGIYFYRLEASDFVKTMKMLLVR